MARPSLIRETVRALARPSLRSYPGPCGFGRLDLATVRPLLSDSALLPILLQRTLLAALLCSAGLLGGTLLRAAAQFRWITLLWFAIIPAACSSYSMLWPSIFFEFYSCVILESNQILFYTSQFVHAMRVHKFILHITVRPSSSQIHTAVTWKKKLRSDAGFPGTPLRLLWRSRRWPDKRGEKIMMHVTSTILVE
jgi:hypothetical protein